MVRIAVCDDDITSGNILAKYIEAFGQEQDIKIQIDCFTEGEKLLHTQGIQNLYDILFMDIYLKPDSPSGTEIIRKLSLSSQTQVVFVTTSREHAVEAFGLNASHYLVKPVTPEQVSEAITRCLERAGAELSHMLDIKTKHGMVSIPMGNIIYIEVFNKLSVIHTGKNSFQTYSSLDSLMNLLDEKSLLRAQRSFIVNMRHIEEFLFDRLILADGTEIMLARRNRSDLKKQYQNYLFHLARRGDL